MQGTQEVFTIKEVAFLNAVSSKTIYRSILSGELEAVRINDRAIRIFRPALIAWLEMCRRRAASPVSRTDSTGTKGHSIS